MRLKLKSSDVSTSLPTGWRSVVPLTSQRCRGRRERGFICTLWEVLIAMVVVVVVFAAIINGYITSGSMAQWTGYSLAAQQAGIQCLEQTRSAVWDPAMKNNEITNLNLLNSSYSASNQNYTYTGYTTNILAVPYKGTNYVIVTNFITIQLFYENNDSSVKVQLQCVRVDTVWPFKNWGNFSSTSLYTNSMASYMAPDNRDPTTF